MSHKDDTGCVTLEQVRLWNAEEIQSLTILLEESTKPEVLKICIAQPE
jgi:hypothetical protein